jgi:hypothetical protein
MLTAAQIRITPNSLIPALHSNNGLWAPSIKDSALAVRTAPPNDFFPTCEKKTLNLKNAFAVRTS